MARTKKEVLMDGVSFQSVALKQIIKPKRTERNRDVGSLRAAIRRHKTVSPILLKPEGERYRVVWGTRRFYACLEEKFTEIPAYVVEADDLKAQSLRVIENAERLAVPLLEEAEQIGELLNLGEQPEVIADSIGRSISWVMRRAKLLNLSDRWKDVVTTGYALIPTGEPPDEEDPYADEEEVESEPARMEFSGWTATHFLVIARFEPHVQDEILNYFLNTPYQDPSSISLSFLQTRIQSYLRTLSQARWDLERDGLAGVGPCRKCTRRLGFQPTLFDDEERTPENDQCLDPVCWGQKMQAYVQERKDALAKDHPDIVLQQGMHQTSDLPDGSPLLEGAYKPYELVRSAPEEEGAFPVLIVNGPEAGEVEWRRVNPNDTSLSSRPGYDEEGNRRPMTLQERKDRLTKRRQKAYGTGLIELLEGEIESPKLLGERSVQEALCVAVTFGTDRRVGKGKYVTPTWDTYKEIDEGYASDPHEVLIQLMRHVAEVWTGTLKEELDFPERLGPLVSGIYRFLGVDPKEVQAAIEQKIPVPKSWAKLNEDGTPKTKA